MTEAEDNQRKRNLAEHVQVCRVKEAEALRNLVTAKADLKRAREKYEQLFLECEQRAVARRLAALANTG